MAVTLAHTAAEERTHVLQNVWHDGGRDAVVTRLLDCQVLQPLAEDTTHVIQKAGRRSKRLEISHPTESPVSLREIRRNADKVASKTPGDVVMQLV
jgi:hypothetical protein